MSAGVDGCQRRGAAVHVGPMHATIDVREKFCAPRQQWEVEAHANDCADRCVRLLDALHVIDDRGVLRAARSDPNEFDERLGLIAIGVWC